MGLFSKKNKMIESLLKENQILKKQNEQLVHLCHEKDSFFRATISDGLRHGSSLSAKHMADRKKHLKGK